MSKDDRPAEGTVTFNEDANLDTSQVEGGGGRTGIPRGGMAIGGGVGGVILLILTLLFGGDITGSLDPTVNPGQDSRLDPAQVEPGGAQAGDFSQCRTGADANRDVECRVIGTVNSVQDFWADALPRFGKPYRLVSTVLYSGATRSACGTASNQVGPFYCPVDRKVYIDASFFAELTSRFGADSGALAQEYVVAHEYGHAIQDQLGLLNRAQEDPRGASSGAVRIELMADCLAGVWARHASQTQSSNGRTFLKVLSVSDIESALSAASAVGDDRIQRRTQGRVTPESWTHGSSAARQEWFLNGYRSGDLNRCDTFAVARLD